MTKFTSELVNELAAKLLIGLTNEENQMVLEEFSIIDETLNKVNELENLNEVTPMTHCLDDFVCTLREDVIMPSIPVEDALKNCKKIEGREVEVPKVVGGDN